MTGVIRCYQLGRAKNGSTIIFMLFTADYWDCLKQQTTKSAKTLKAATKTRVSLIQSSIIVVVVLRQFFFEENQIKATFSLESGRHFHATRDNIIIV